MKANAIFRIILWSVILVALTAVLMSFVADERYLSQYTEASQSVPVSEERPVSPLPNGEKLTLIPTSVKQIEIEWVAGSIILQPADTDVISISESDVSDSRYTMAWQDTGGKLEIYFAEDIRISDFGVSLNDVVEKDLYIYVPRDWHCEALEIDTASASVEIRDLTIRDLDFDGASGEFWLSGCTINDLDIDTASGNVTFSGTLETLDFDAASASFTGVLDNTPVRMDMDSMSGTMDIALPQDCGYTLSIDGLSSHYRSEFQETTENDCRIYGDGRCRIQVDGLSCDVSIRQNEDASFRCTEPDCTLAQQHTHETIVETFRRDACYATDCTDPRHDHE